MIDNKEQLSYLEPLLKYNKERLKYFENKFAEVAATLSLKVLTEEEKNYAEYIKNSMLFHKKRVKEFTKTIEIIKNKEV
jgi:hypothetical protein